MADGEPESDVFTRDNFIKIAIAGTTVAMAFTGEYAHVGLVNLTPACMNLLKDGDKYTSLLKKSGRTKANPLWLANKIFDAKADPDRRSPVTIEYLRSRKIKGLAGTAVSISGTASSSHSAGVNVPGALKEMNASASTMMHIAKIGVIGRDKDLGEEVARWIDTIIRMKTAKLGIRGMKLASAAIPIPVASVPISVVAAFAALGLEISNKALCDLIASQVHYRARMENNKKVTLRGGGPATEIMRELFTRRGATRIFGSYDVDAFIREPAGWMAVADKIGSI